MSDPDAYPSLIATDNTTTEIQAGEGVSPVVGKRPHSTAEIYSSATIPVAIAPGGYSSAEVHHCAGVTVDSVPCRYTSTEIKPSCRVPITIGTIHHYTEIEADRLGLNGSTDTGDQTESNCYRCDGLFIGHICSPLALQCSHHLLEKPR